ncbi:MAG TPA: hypothetical protein VN915_06000 [Elusimicrobiota bacterium]|nr:hypothetical protein [Elusimicrobiota bacterium]
MRLFAAALLLSVVASSASAKDLDSTSVPMPGGGAGIGFDDLGYAPGLNKMLVPGGRTGRLFLVDPGTRKVSSVGGFTPEKDYKRGHGEGVTSADEGRGLLFGTDRNRGAVVAVDPKTGAALASAKLSGGPDYVRYAAPTGELWVSEPSAEKIELFTLSGGTAALTIAKAGEISVPGGPESLVIDAARGRAYAHTWKGESLAIGLKSRAVEARWANGCTGSRGIALDETRGFLFAGCDEGKAVVLDAAHGGKVLSSLESGKGVDVIAYSERLRHLYLPGADSATMAIIAVGDDGTLKLLKTLKTAKGAHCAAADESGGAWVCDPDAGRLLYFKDGGGASR